MQGEKKMASWRGLCEGSGSRSCVATQLQGETATAWIKVGSLLKSALEKKKS